MTSTARGKSHALVFSPLSLLTKRDWNKYRKTFLAKRAKIYPTLLTLFWLCTRQILVLMVDFLRSHLLLELVDILDYGQKDKIYNDSEAEGYFAVNEWFLTHLSEYSFLPF
jgi:hypothetical protein